MLGLGTSLSTKSGKTLIDPTSVKSLVSWYDFQDKRSMYTDAGSTNIASDGQTIYRIDNKAYTQQKNDTKAIGKYLEQSSAANRPVYRAANGGYADFDGSNDILLATKDIGNVATNKLSDTTLNGINLTLFFVTQADSATVGADQYLMHLCGGDVQTRMSIYVDNSTNDRWQWHHQDNVARRNTTLNCTENLTTNKELWCIHLDSTTGSSFYRNNNITDGTASGTADDNDIDLSVNDSDVKFILGSGGAGSTYFAGNVFEFILFDRALTLFEQKKIGYYLMGKHRI